MNVLIACQGREYHTSAAKSAALALRDVLRARGAKVFLDAYCDAQILEDAQLLSRTRSVVSRADAMILVLEDAYRFYDSRLYQQWMDFETQNINGLFAVYAMPTLEKRALPAEFTQRWMIFDAPGAMEQLADILFAEFDKASTPTPQITSTALQTRDQGAPPKTAGRPKGKKHRWILPLILILALVLTAAIGIPKWIEKKEAERLAAEMAAQAEAERIAREQAEYEEQHRTMHVTIIEGSTIEQMASQLEEEIRAQGGEFSADTFLSLCKTGDSFIDYDFIADAANVENVSQRFYVLEGYLFPDTYEIYVHTSEQDVIIKMLDRFDEIVSDESFSSALVTSGMTLDEAVTLASVVQKEGTADSFSKISGVFHNRLDAGMLLQSDVTAQYVTGKQSLTMSTDDVAVDSPYNTYVYAGLPAGPIANPGAAALRAAVSPDDEIVSGGYYYFVLTDPATGVIAYSKTYAEHEAIANQYAHLWR